MGDFAAALTEAVWQSSHDGTRQQRWIDGAFQHGEERRVLSLRNRTSF